MKHSDSDNDDFDDNADIEEITDELKINQKRKNSDLETDEIPSKKRKKANLKKVAPPTAEEINRLKETENVFHSNLFRMQIEETLKEVKMKETTRAKLISWVDSLENALLDINFDLEGKLTGADSLDVPYVVLPFKNKPRHADTLFKFVKPKSVNVFGSFNTSSYVKNLSNIDIAVEMPKEVFQKEDYLNEKYLRKRNYYLSCLASFLSEQAGNNSLVDPEIQFVLKNCEDKPLLLVKPLEGRLNKYSIYIHVVPEAGTFKELRFSPSHNNIRYRWYYGTDNGDGKLNYPTPYYNSLICQDLVTLRNDEVRAEVFQNHPNFNDALIILKIWLHQRELDEGLSSFTGYLIAMFMVYLCKKRRLNQHMSSYQIIRNVWVALDQSNWHEEGISLALNTESKKNSAQSFQSSYEVVFLDVTGTTNLASLLSINTYLQVKSESKFAVECLDNQTANFYPALFMTKISILQQYDHILHFGKISKMRKVTKADSNTQLNLDLRNNIVLKFSKLITAMLKKSLGKRVSLMSFIVKPLNLKWSVSESKPSYESVIIGLKLHPEYAFNVIDKGPVANLPEAEEFRKFWSEKSELRRFKDGSVCETVCWGASNDSMRKKRLFIREITKYILEKKFQIKPKGYVYIADQVESVLYDKMEIIFGMKGTGEEEAVDLLASFDDLAKKLKELNNTPLLITSVLGTSSIFRYSEPIPVLPNITAVIKKVSTTTTDGYTAFRDDVPLKSTPLYVPAVEVTIQFSATNKWPTDLGAIRRLQAAFYIKLSEILKREYNYTSYPHTNFMHVLKDGYVFRIRISNNGEIAAVKRQINSEGVIEYCDNKESLHLEKTLVQLPALTSAIHGLHSRYPSFGPASSIAKRWLRCHLIDEYYFPNICVDLLISYLFLYPEPYTPAYQPQTAFIRFLKLLSSASWLIEPIIVNFHNEMTREEIIKIDSYFNTNRSGLPSLFIVTPFDKTGVSWTRNEPSAVILDRLSKLANAALALLETGLFTSENYNHVQTLFNPPLKGYDLLIWTHPNINTLRWLAANTNAQSLPSLKQTSFNTLPIVDFHPVELYITELRKHYSDQCVFLYNFYGGNVIGVVLKPGISDGQEFKVSNMKCCKLNKQNKISLDTDSLIDDFYILGNGIVSYIEKCNNDK